MIPNRTYIFTAGGVTWVDTWYDRFEGGYFANDSKTVDAGVAWFGCGQDTMKVPVFHAAVDLDATRLGNTGGPGTVTQTMTVVSLGSLSVGIGGPGILVLRGEVTTEVVKSGIVNGLQQIISATSDSSTDTIALDILTGQQFPWSFVENLDGMGAPALTAVTAAQPVKLTIAGDYRRAAFSEETTRGFFMGSFSTPPTSTAILADDELFALAALATQLSLSTAELFAILQELTGLRRSAYHPDGFYGICNLTPAQITASIRGQQSTGVTRPVLRVKDLLMSSVAAQIGVASAYFSSLNPAVSTVIPVFFTLASGQACPGVSDHDKMPVPPPLPPRLQPLSSDGVTVTGADVAAKVDARLNTIGATEFAARALAGVTSLGATNPPS